MTLLQIKSDAMEKYKEELLGSATDFVTSDVYNMIGLGRELMGSYEEFSAMIHDPKRIRIAAKLIAHHQLKNMVELVQRHDMLQRQKMEKLAKGKKK